MAAKRFKQVIIKH